MIMIEFLFKISLLFCIYSMLTISQNFLLGKVGIVYIGHVVFFAIGAYTTVILITIFSFNSYLTILIAILFSIIISSGLGILTIRLSGHYLLLASLGTCEIVNSIINNSRITGGAEGILINNGINDQNIINYYLIIILFVTQILFFLLLNKSPKGRIFRAVRDDEVTALLLGHSINKLKLEAIVISAIWASIAGSLYALYSNYIDPSSFTILESIAIFIVILIGGIGTIRGSLIGSFIMIVFPELLRFLNLPSTLIGPVRQLIIGVILIAIISYKPEGILGEYKLK